MRDCFVNTLYYLAKNDNRIKVVTGDLGFGVLSKFYNDLPECFINAGIAEQNMTSFAAGLALEGFRPVTYSIGNFPTLRCLEQIRNDICYHNANVKIVSVGSGYAYGVLGMSHHSTEDIGIIGSLPNIEILSPCDKSETKYCVEYMMSIKKPCYLRLGRNGSENLNITAIDKINQIVKGNDFAIFCTGEIIKEAIVAAKLLRENGISVAVYSCPFLKPFPSYLFEKIIHFNSFKMIFSLEEHNIINGLGSILSDVICQKKLNILLEKIGIDDCYCSSVGSQEYLRKVNGINSNEIIKRIKKSAKI